MGFNYGLEKKRFDQRWEALEREYRAAGMEETAIQELYAYDYDMFKNERRYRTHTQENTGYEEGGCDPDADSPLSRIFIERFSMTITDMIKNSSPRRCMPMPSGSSPGWMNWTVKN